MGKEKQPTGVGGLLQTILDRVVVANFRKMPRWVQIIVYFIMVGLVSFGIVWTLYWTVGPQGNPTVVSDEIEITGCIKAPNGGGLPDSLMHTELIGENVYVHKRATHHYSQRFVYEWLIKLKRSEVNTPIPFAFVRYSQQKGIYTTLCERDIYPSMFIANAPALKPHLEVDNDFLSLSLVVPPEKDSAMTEQPGYASSWLIPSAWAQTKSTTQAKPKLSLDSARRVYEAYKESKNPINQMSMKKELDRAGDEYMVMVAEELKQDVLQNRRIDAINHAQVLANFSTVGQLSSSGTYAVILTDKFYEKAVGYITSGVETENRTMTILLRRIQDARVLPYVFRSYQPAKNDLSKKLLLQVVEGFAYNSNTAIKQRIKTWLQQQNQTASKEVNQSIAKLLKIFSGS
ncbi:MAG: hypothetical protein V1799_01550 [bacterium]